MGAQVCLRGLPRRHIVLVYTIYTSPSATVIHTVFYTVTFVLFMLLQSLLIRGGWVRGCFIWGWVTATKNPWGVGVAATFVAPKAPRSEIFYFCFEKKNKFCLVGQYSQYSWAFVNKSTIKPHFRPPLGRFWPKRPKTAKISKIKIKLQLKISQRS